MRNSFLKYFFLNTILLFLLGFSNVVAQQEPQYTNYMFNIQPINPAYTGSTSKASATVLTRLQWVGLQGAPRTTSFSFQTPLPRAKAGLGISVVSDRIGPVQNLYVNIDYAYHIRFNSTHRLSFGLGVGFYNYYVGLDGVPINPTSVMGQPDAAFANSYVSNFQPNVGAGVYYYGGRLTVGLSAPKLLTARLSSSPSSYSSGMRQHLFIMANYIIPINEKINFRPGFLEKLVAGSPPSTDVTAQFSFHEFVIAGASYRVGDAFAGLLAIQATPSLLVGYSYDYPSSSIKGYNNGSHEVFLTYSFAFPKNNPCEVEPLLKTYHRKQKVVKNGKPLSKSSGAKQRR